MRRTMATTIDATQPGKAAASVDWAARARLVALVLVLALALALRLVALDRLLPHFVEPDAFWSYHLMELRGEVVPDGVDYRERYPSLVPTLLSAVAPPAAPRDLAGALAAAAQPFVLVRGVAALCGVLACALAYLFARRLAGAWTALACAALVAASPLHLLCSTQARPHAVVAATSLACLLACVRLVERPSPTRAMVAALAAGFALASLQNGVFVLPPLCLATWWAVRGAKGLLCAAGAALLALLVGLPWWPGLPTFVDGALRLGGSGAHQLGSGEYDFSGFATAARLLFEHDPWLAVLPLFGLWAARAQLATLARGWFDGSHAARNLLLAHAVPYLVVAGANREYYERFWLPVLPAVALLAAIGFGWLAAAAWRATTPLVTRAAAFLLLVLGLALPAAGVAAWWRLSSRLDSIEEAARVLAPLDARVATSPVLALPTLLAPAELEATLAERDGRVVPWVAWQASRQDDLAPLPRSRWRLLPSRVARPKEGAAERCDEWLAQVAPSHACVEVSRRTLHSPGTMHLLQRARADGSTLEPGGAPAPDPADLDRVVFAYQAIPGFYARLLEADRFGPPLELRAMRP
jgi:hypothetical protein